MASTTHLPAGRRTSCSTGGQVVGWNVTIPYSSMVLIPKGAYWPNSIRRPQKGLYPTSAWLPQQTIIDLHTLNLPPGTTALKVGLYDPETLARLSVTGEDGVPLPDGAVVIQVPHEN